MGEGPGRRNKKWARNRVDVDSRVRARIPRLAPTSQKDSTHVQDCSFQAAPPCPGSMQIWVCNFVATVDEQKALHVNSKPDSSLFCLPPDTPMASQKRQQSPYCTHSKLQILQLLLQVHFLRAEIGDPLPVSQRLSIWCPRLLLHHLIPSPTDIFQIIRYH